MTITCPSKKQFLPALPDYVMEHIKYSDEELNNSKQLYYHKRVTGTKVYKYNKNENILEYVGSHTGYTAIAHNGISTGKIQIEKNNECSWISGLAIYDENNGLIII